MSEASYRYEQLAVAAAQELGYQFPRPIKSRQLSSPIVHWELVASPQNGKEVVVLLDIHGDTLNVLFRPVQTEAPRPWWKKALGL